MAALGIAVSALSSVFSSWSFVSSSLTQDLRCSSISRRAEAPSSESLAAVVPSDVRGPWRTFLRKAESDDDPESQLRDKFAKHKEAERFRPHLLPLIQAQYSMKEITFALNRMGAKLRHLLWKPNVGLPTFKIGNVKRIVHYMKNPTGAKSPRTGALLGMERWIRPNYIPRFAPGAYLFSKKGLEASYAEVPPLKPFDTKEDWNENGQLTPEATERRIKRQKKDSMAWAPKKKQTTFAVREEARRVAAGKEMSQLSSGE